MKKQIACKCGIFDTAYTLICHRDGSVSIKAPFIKWSYNNENLYFWTSRVSSPEMVKKVKGFFERQELATDTGGTLDEYMY